MITSLVIMMLRVTQRRRVCKIALPTGFFIYLLQIALKNNNFLSNEQTTPSSQYEMHIKIHGLQSKSKADEMSLETTDVIDTANQNEIKSQDVFLMTDRINSNAHRGCSNLTMFIAVMSGPEARRDRDTIRTLWGDHEVIAEVNARVVFFIGKIDSSRIQETIEEENAQYKDIVQFEIIDDYDNLTNKSLSMMKWFEEHCKNTRWYVKADVDSFWNIYGLRDLLESHDKRRIMNTPAKHSKNVNDRVHFLNPNKTAQTHDQQSRLANSLQTEMITESFETDDVTIVCPRAAGLRVCREYEYDRCEERYVVSKKEYPLKFYPPHCHGFSYVLRSDLVSKILQEDEDRSLNGLARFRMEDVYVTGILVKHIHVKYIDISSRTLSFPKSVSEAVQRPLLLLHGPERWLPQGSAKQIWDHIATHYRDKNSAWDT